MNIVTLSGWGQDHDALECIAPNATHLNYSNFTSTTELFSNLKNIKCDVIIGWSLGGQLALRAIEQGVISPKLQLLIGTPFQFISSHNLKCGIGLDVFQTFVANFKEDPTKTLRQFALLVAKNDQKSKEMLKKLHKNSSKDAQKWLYWLEELGSFSCNRLDFSNMPKTIAIHGRNDAVVDCTQTGLFRSLIHDYRHVIIDNCGHAPHLHDSKAIMDLIDA